MSTSRRIAAHFSTHVKPKRTVFRSTDRRTDRPNGKQIFPERKWATHSPALAMSACAMFLMKPTHHVAAARSVKRWQPIASHEQRTRCSREHRTVRVRTLVDDREHVLLARDPAGERRVRGRAATLSRSSIT